MSMLRLFDSLEREDLNPADYGEPSFSYYNRSARPECHRSRETLELWFSDYPVSGQDELRSRFRSSDDHNHSGAFFELYCYTLLSRQRFSVDLHPALKNTKKTRPDFEISDDDSYTFYLESMTVQPRDHVEAKNLHQLYDYLNHRLHAPNFFLHVRVLGDVPKKMLSLSGLADKLHDWLACLNPDEVLVRAVAQQDRGRGLMGLPKVVIEQEAWRIAFEAMPVSASKRGKPDHRPVGTTMRRPTSSWIDTQKPLLPALQKKAGDYGQLNRPYIIAVNSQDFTDTDDIMTALFGRDGISVDRETGQVSEMRFADGLWTARGGRNSRVSGVLITSLLGPLTLERAQPVLWHNPWAAYPFDPDKWWGPQMIAAVETGMMQFREGMTCWDILEVPPE